MIFNELPLTDLFLIKPRIFEDDRGFFYESFHQGKFQINGIDINIVQQNHSGSKKNILRGLHYQIKNSQGKLVRVLKGEVFDVAVDLRKSSPTFGCWEGINLSDENKNELWIPPGFAHGFYVLSNWVEVEYSTTDFYDPQSERTIIWNDPELNIKWPIPDGEKPILSDKDSQGKLFKDAEIYE
ncbi:MAG: dTDP-4-dehydrorhamnose 3,5-epimerase [Anaerolineaceae bacterium]|nr:dTDP-4-dehydrorhamnose 3,5-epimerase [Anaerolineaceae bacterium]